VIPGHVAIYVATGPVDLRWSFDVLSGVVKDRIRQDPRAGALFVFLNKRRTRVKVLFYDRTGYCMLYKRLDVGTFPLPVVIAPGAEHVVISAAELDLILRGIDAPPPARARAARTKKSSTQMH
jgi:transposase